MDAQRLRFTLDNIKFRDWEFETWLVAPQTMAFRVVFEAPDSQTGNEMTQWSRWWIVEPDDTEENVVKTALLAVLTATEHEVREDFYYKEKRVHSPHKKV